MFKLTHVSGALAALLAATVLSGCGGGDVPQSVVASPTTTGSDAQNADAQDAVDAAAKALAAAKVATAQAATAAKARARAKANPADPAAAQAAKKADAAVAYWSIITRFNLANAAHTKVTKVSDGRANLPAIPESFRAAARAFSAANAREAAELRAYVAWPQSVKPWIDKFIAQKEILAGYHLRMAAAAGWDAWDQGDKQSQVGSAETARLSTLIRQGLGLPPRG